MTTYVCYYCGAHHGHPMGDTLRGCCHEVHFEPREEFVEIETEDLSSEASKLAESLRRLDYKDYWTQADKNWRAAASARLDAITREIDLREGRRR